VRKREGNNEEGQERVFQGKNNHVSRCIKIAIEWMHKLEESS